MEYPTFRGKGFALVGVTAYNGKVYVAVKYFVVFVSTYGILMGAVVICAEKDMAVNRCDVHDKICIFVRKSPFWQACCGRNGQPPRQAVA